VSIFLLGSPKIVLDGQAISISRRKSRALLYYVAAQPVPVSRERLLNFFWPDYERPAAQRNLRSTLYNLRQIVAPLLLVEDNVLGVAPQIQVDVLAFEQTLSLPSLDITTLSETLALYQGDFLSGVQLPDSPAFEDWLFLERERLRRLTIRGLSRLSHMHEAQGHYQMALESLDRALSFDPLQEDLQRACLRLHYLAGDRAGAIRRYERLRQMLDTEMGVPPMAETHALYDAIITDTFKPEPTRPAIQSTATLKQDIPPVINATWPASQPNPTSDLSVILPFTGRVRELERLRDLAQSQKFVLIEGEAGIGKTRLIAEFRHTLTSQPHPLILVGQGRELEHALPYHPLIEALRSLFKSDHWASLRPGLELLPVWQAEVGRLVPEFCFKRYPNTLTSAKCR
jgi:DNA-binding SARP family transcriptional activator